MPKHCSKDGQSLQEQKWEFPKIRGTFLGVPAFGALHWVPLFWETTKCHGEPPERGGRAQSAEVDGLQPDEGERHQMGRYEVPAARAASGRTRMAALQ